MKRDHLFRILDNHRTGLRALSIGALSLAIGFTCLDTATRATGQQLPPPRSPMQQVPRDTGNPQPASARVRGRVIAADTDQPLRRAQVRLISDDQRENRIAVTDVSGRYEFKELPSGRYQLTAMKGNFISLQYGQRRPFEPGRQIELGERQQLENVDFRLPKGGLVTGRVLDEFGEPLADVQVSALRYQVVQGRQQLVSAERIVQTNDVGEYRLFGLPPAQYYVSASLRSVRADSLVGSLSSSDYAPSYYPNTTNLSDAERVRVTSGQTVNGVDIVLVPTPLSRIVGTVSDSEGKPVTRGVVTVLRTSGVISPTIWTAQIRSDSSFVVPNVPPGEYTLRAMSPLGLAAGEFPELICASVTVDAEDVTGVTLLGLKSAKVSGRVILSPPIASISAASLQLSAVLTTPGLLSGAGTGRVREDFTFEMTVQPGRHWIRLGSQLRDVTLKAVLVDQYDVTDEGIEVLPGKDITTVEIEISTVPTELTGTVFGPRHDPVSDYSVVLFSRHPQRWSNGGRYLGLGRPDQDGRFRVRNLSAGQYYAIALDYIEPGSNTDPEFLETIRQRATEVSLMEGATKTVDLPLISLN